MVFFLTFIITNFVFSFTVYNIFFIFNNGEIKFKNELFLYALGVGPAITALILYYSFLILPKRSNFEYLLVVLTIFSIIVIVSFFINNKSQLKSQNFKTRLKNKYTLFMPIFLLVITGTILLDVTKILDHPMIGHDSLVHGVMGKILYAEKSLDPIWVGDYSKQGFIYGLARKPPSFSLLLTWEKIIGSFLNTDSDLYYKSTTVYYSLLIVALTYIILSKQSVPIAIIGVVAILSAPGFLLTLLRPHLDSFRIFFYYASLIFLYYSIKNTNFFNMFMLGLFSGLSAFTHTIGLLAAVLNFLIFMIIVRGNFKPKVYKTLFLSANILVFGVSHQIFNLIWGRNWIF